MLPNSYTSASSVRDAQFQIGGEHPVFGHNPWTQQAKGCGKQGDKISAGFQYILQYNETDNGHSIPGMRKGGYEIESQNTLHFDNSQLPSWGENQVEFDSLQFPKDMCKI